MVIFSFFLFDKLGLGFDYNLKLLYVGFAQEKKIKIISFDFVLNIEGNLELL